MPGINSAGTPSPKDYLLGRGAIWSASILTNGFPGAYQHLGNAPDFSVSATTETQEHFSSLEGLRTLDKEVIISQELGLTFTLEEFSHDNLARQLSGTAGVQTNVAVAGFAEHALIPAGNYQPGRHYEIRNSAGGRAYDIDAADVTLKFGSDTALVLNTDYIVETEFGTFFLLPSPDVASAVTDGTKSLNCTLTAKSEAAVVETVQALTTTPVQTALKFISINPANNDSKLEFQFHSVSLKADGDSALIGDDYATMGFTSRAEKDAAGRTCTIARVKPAS